MKTSGAGYGDPAKRDPLRVARDVRLGYVSRERALADYRVALDASGAVLKAQTARLRKYSVTFSSRSSFTVEAECSSMRALNAARSR